MIAISSISWRRTLLWGSIFFGSTEHSAPTSVRASEGDGLRRRVPSVPWTMGADEVYPCDQNCLLRNKMPNPALAERQV